ncbi:hypothetical protein BKA57DRAFT_501146 [Linnemannia elongata]|nr:hypothetical protein BKA57DRAFT_501146 [Linnemannia elongata]
MDHINYFTTDASDEECVQRTKEFARNQHVPNFFIISDGLMTNDGRPYVTVYIKFKGLNWSDSVRLLATKGPVGSIAVAGMVHNKTQDELLEEATYWENGILDFEGSTAYVIGDYKICFPEVEQDRSTVPIAAVGFVNEFATFSLKSTEVIFKVLLHAPCLEEKYYRKVLSCVIDEFKASTLLNIELLVMFKASSPDFSEKVAGTVENDSIRLWNLQTGAEELVSHPVAVELPSVVLDMDDFDIRALALFSTSRLSVWKDARDESFPFPTRHLGSESPPAVTTSRFGFGINNNPTRLKTGFVSQLSMDSFAKFAVSPDIQLRQLWEPNFRNLCAADVILDDVTGLSSNNKMVLTQRGAIYIPSAFKRMNSEE